jgi:hypothetical protein
VDPLDSESTQKEFAQMTLAPDALFPAGDLLREVASRPELISAIKQVRQRMCQGGA